METFVSTLSNGIRVVYLHNDSPVSHCGLMVGAGCRDEITGQEGLAHFIEHVLFKGTKKRKSYQILNRLEIVGGELNAYTTKEETCIHASFMNEHFQRAVELMSDIFFHSVFPEKEIEKEKDVVIDEINSYKDSPMEQIYDDFECLVFKGQPLGKPILGTPGSVRSFNRKIINEFISKHYTNDKLVFSYAGRLSFTDVMKAAEKFLSGEGRTSKSKGDRKNVNSRRVIKVEKKKTVQAHYISGNKAYSCYSKKRYPLFLMNNILGGPGMNSRLNMNIREKYGFTYQIESAYVPFRDAGLFNVYLATEKKFLEKTLSLVEKEFRKLRNDKIGVSQLSRFKYQLKGQIAISQENKAGLMLNNAKSILNYNKPVNISEIFKRLDEITPVEILEVSNEILDPSELSSLLYDPDPSKTDT